MGLNAAQMIVAVLVYRHCDAMRRRHSDDPEAEAQRAYSQYVLSAMVGKALMRHTVLESAKLNHLNFKGVKEYFDNNKDALYSDAERRLIGALSKEFDMPLDKIDGRSLAAAFRRFDFIENVLKNA